MFEHCMGKIKGSFDVQVDDPFPGTIWRIFERNLFVPSGPGVIDQYIDLAESRQNFLHYGFDVVVFGDVRGKG